MAKHIDYSSWGRRELENEASKRNPGKSYSAHGDRELVEELSKPQVKSKRSTSDGYMPKREKFEKAREAHKAGAPYKTAEEAIKSPTFSAMHKARKEMNKK